MCRYREHILAFVSYSSASEKERSAAEDRCLVVAAQEAGLYGGASETMPLSDGDLSIRQALSAVASAQRQGLRLVRWADLHLDAFAIAAKSDRLFMSASDLHRSKLAAYDEEHGTELMRTAEVLVARHGDVKAIADELHQHPNTVRYRMRKIKAVLDIPREDDKALVNLLSLVFLPDLARSK
ncbi:PucR family transcriptional regulator [Gordonibacter sp. An230]|uniref:PucR family transcriptional regulator n=1 Tax=Gordonibacter sp. An230 TaxID=1965592 RepID=UPI001EF61841|nr:helix-turn-helix domain-containing protein [Gordonibacter sp. An230]